MNRPPTMDADAIRSLLRSAHPPSLAELRVTLTILRAHVELLTSQIGAVDDWVEAVGGRQRCSCGEVFYLIPAQALTY